MIHCELIEHLLHPFLETVLNIITVVLVGSENSEQWYYSSDLLILQAITMTKKFYFLTADSNMLYENR
jgi:hypothetical protein